jgi:hypothetical protein
LLTDRRPIAFCGRFTQAYTWRESVALYGLTQPALNLQPRYNIGPTPAQLRCPLGLPAPDTPPKRVAKQG